MTCKQKRHSKDFSSHFQTEVCKQSLDSFGLVSLWFGDASNVFYYSNFGSECIFIRSLRMKYDSYLHLLTCWERKKKKKDEQTPAERNKKKRSWFNFPQDFLGLGCKWLCYQKLCKRGKSKRQWQSQQWFELRIWPSGNVDLEST